MDSCQHYANAQMGDKWTFVASPTLVGAASPRGTTVIKFQSPCSVTRSHQSSFIWGWRYQLQASIPNTGGTIYSCMHAGVELGGVRQEADGTLTIFSGSGTAISSGGNVQNTGNPAVVMPPFAMHAFVWYYFEIMCTLSGGGSSNVHIDIQFRVNTQPMLSGSGDCGVTGNSLLLQTNTANNHQFQGTTGNVPSYGCDFQFIINDGTGLYNAFVGDTAINCIFPDSDQTINWNSTGSPSYQQINDNPPDGDATYIYMAPTGTPPTVVGQIDNFLWQPIAPFTGQIIAVHLLAYARKDDEGTREFQFTVGAGVPPTPDTPPVFYPSDSYVYFDFTWDHDPALTAGSGPYTYGAWTQAGFNATKFGVKLVA
jgi:hypothetical protein